MMAKNLKFLLLIIVIVVTVFLNGSHGDTKSGSKSSIDGCTHQQTCAKCIQTPNCVWCSETRGPSHQSNANPRCVERNSLTAMTKGGKNNWCNKDMIVDLRSEVITEKALPFSTDKVHPIQLTPQRVKMLLRPGDAMELTVRYKQVADYPVDLYYLMDLSRSMEIHRDNLSALGLKLAEAMLRLTSNFSIGFGSFVDKVVLPMTSTFSDDSCGRNNKKCASPYGYKHQMSLTSNVDKFKDSVLAAPISENIDRPEGGFDAVMQAIACWDKIGWRDQARHLLVYSSDAQYHIAGDGRLAGIIEPNDEMCHLNEAGFYTHAEILDYPSISQIKKKAEDKNINIIFAVTSDVFGIYSALSNHLTGSSIGQLDKNSKNVVDLISGVYKELTNKIVMKHNATGKLEVTMTTNCGNEHYAFQEREACGDVRVNNVLDFRYTIKAVGCPERPEDWHQTFEIKPQGVNEKVIVEVEMLCDCPCSREGDKDNKPNSPECNTNGTLVCGVCSCDVGYSGEYCHCKKDDKSKNNDANLRDACRPDNTTTQECNGRGRCDCGSCDCNPGPNPGDTFYGKYCECDNFSCDRSYGLVCGGPERGICECGVCNCNPGLTGKGCRCVASNATCLPPGENSKICNGFGECECGSCVCDPDLGRSGKYCEECPTCPNQRCDELKDCVECMVHKSGPEFENDPKCEKCMSTVDMDSLVDKIEIDLKTAYKNGEHICTMPDEAGCSFTFVYSNINRADSEIITVTAERDKKCPLPPVDAIAFAAGAIAITLFLGLLGLVAWKVLTMIHDNREFAKFEKERHSVSYKGGTNPLYKEATSTFRNPMFENQESTK